MSKPQIWTFWNAHDLENLAEGMTKDAFVEGYATTTTNHPNPQFLFRKLRLSVFYKKQQADEKLLDSVNAKFGSRSVFVIRNWSAPHTRYHEPIRGVSFRRLLKKNNCNIYLIDEYKTSKCCPICDNESLATFKMVPNPRPYRRPDNPLTICHGLLRCTNQNCTAGMAEGVRQPRLWNRDLVATLNMHHILRGLREDAQRETTTGKARKVTTCTLWRVETTVTPTKNFPRQLSLTHPG
ncbi:hypothetical protein BX666DRAFT_2025443 [Dichotomocladium elegans]|nr:hypothetical protein BX666DRAFT_2025443 [Dichotomocladium elegans]